MARKKREEESAGGCPAWLATFGDLMNLLLCFFVLLFAMSSVDAEKYEQVAASFSNSFSVLSSSATGVGDGQMISSGASQLNNMAEYFSDMGLANESEVDGESDPLKEYEKDLQEKQKAATEELYDEIAEMAEKNKVADFVDLGIDSKYQYVKISMSGAILFDSGKADVKKEAIPILSKVGDILKVYDKYLIKIEGHTDNVPITNSTVYKNNMWLSTARASTVWEYFTENKDLDAKTLESSGRSQFDPIASNDTSEGRAKNRRVEIKIYSDLVD